MGEFAPKRSNPAAPAAPDIRSERELVTAAGSVFKHETGRLESEREQDPENRRKAARRLRHSGFERKPNNRNRPVGELQAEDVQNLLIYIE